MARNPKTLPKFEVRKGREMTEEEQKAMAYRLFALWKRAYEVELLSKREAA